MGGLVVLLIGAGLWVFLGPVFSLVALSRTGALKRENEALRKAVDELKQGQAKPAPEEPAPKAQAPAPAPVQEEPTAPEAVPATPAAAAKPRPKQPPVWDKSAAASAEATEKPFRWERAIAANWLVWGGGLALALGGAFLVRIVIDAGLFGPAARTLTAALFGAGLIAAAFRIDGRPFFKEADNALAHLPSILAGAGVVTLYGACLAAGALYGLIPPLLALGFFAAVSIAALSLSLRFGFMIAVLGVSGAYVSPLLTGAEGGSPLFILPYAGAITAAGLVLTQMRGWLVLSIIGVCGAFFWGAAVIADGADRTGWIVPAYSIALAAGALWLGLTNSSAPLAFQAGTENPLSALRKRGDSFFAAYIVGTGMGLLLLLHALDGRGTSTNFAWLALYAGAGLFIAGRREGFALLAPITVGLFFIAHVLEPVWPAGHGAWLLAAAALISGFGLFLSLKTALQTPLAATSAFALPGALFLAFWRENDAEQGALWALASLALAALAVFVLELLARRDKDFKNHPGAGAAYGVSAVFGLALASFYAFTGLWLGTAAALAAFASVGVYKRFPLPAVRWLAAAAAVSAVALLGRPWTIATADISSVPFFNELLFSFGGAALALFASAWLLRGEAQSHQVFMGGGLLLVFAMIGLLIRHAAGGGSLNGPSGGLGEASGYAISYLGLAVTTAWRMKTASLLYRALEYGGLVAGTIAVVMGLAALSWDRASGAVLFNLLFTSLAMPAVLLGVYAIGLRRAGRARLAEAAGGAGVALGFVWALTETRRAFVGPLIDNGAPFGQVELWMYSLVALGYAFCLMAWGVWRLRASVRYAAIALLGATLVKVFIFDLAALDGAIRAFSFIALGGALILVAVFYQRFASRLEAPAPEGGAPPKS